jgi:sugar lactone lactonase YvrE
VTTGLGALRVLAEGLDHPEGVTVTPIGQLYAGGEAGQVYRVDPATGAVAQVANTKGFLLGLCSDAGGNLYCCDVARRQVLRVFPSNGDVEVYSRGTRHRPMVNPNWPVFDARGNLYVTDSGTWKGNDGCIFRVQAGGATEVWCEESTNFPNGAALSADGKSLLVLESCTPALVRIPILPNGAPGPRKIVAELTGVPDGVALDEDGAAYICYYRPDRIDRVHPDGKVETLAEDPEGTLLSAPTNGVWIGENRDVLVVGNLGRWHLTACEWGVRGLALRYPEIPA